MKTVMNSKPSAIELTVRPTANALGAHLSHCARRIAKLAQRQSVVLLAAGVLATGVLGAFAQELDSSTPVAGGKLNPGDIVYTDSGNAIEGAFINRIDAVSGQE